MDNDLNVFFNISLKYFVFTLLIREIETLFSYVEINVLFYFLILIPLVYLEIKYLVYKKLDNLNIKRDSMLLYFLILFPAINIFFRISLIYTIMVVAFLLILQKGKTKDEIMTLNILEYYKNKNKKM